MKALLIGAGFTALLTGSALVSGASAMQPQGAEGRPAGRPSPAPRAAQAPASAPAQAPATPSRPQGGGFRGGGMRPEGARGGFSPGTGQSRPDFGARGPSNFGGRPDAGARGGGSVQAAPDAQPALAGRPDGFRGGRFGQPGVNGGFQGRRFGGQDRSAFAGQAFTTTPQPGAAAPSTSDGGVRNGGRQGFGGDAGRQGVDRNGDGRIDRTDRRYGGGDRTNFRFDGDRGGFSDRTGGRDGRYGRAGGGRAFSYNGSRHNAFRARAFAFPRGYAYRRYGRGYRLPFVFLAPSYYLYDWSSFYLTAPPSDVYRWVRYGPDALLVDTRTGDVIDAAYGVFYDGSTYGDAYGYEDGYDGSDGRSAYDPGSYGQGDDDSDGYPVPPDGYGDAPR